MRLESYEDALSNVELPEDKSVERMVSLFGDEYLIKYMLDLDTAGSVLNLAAFNDPFDYKLKVTEKNETKEVNADLMETFNYLIGLTVEKMYARKIFSASPDLAGEYEGAVKLIGNDNGEYIFRQIEGTLPSGERALIIWRNITDNLLESNAALDAYFQRYRINPADREYDVIYVNGDNNIANLKNTEETWKVRMIEPEFKSRMFEEE
jgi:adenine-specific DNA-methyltransferase